MDTKIHRSEVFAPNRDELFLNRLCSDIFRLEQSGFSPDEIKKMLGTFNYVRVWINTPRFLYPTLSLPKGYVWKSGVKYKCDYGVKGYSEKVTYVLLPIGRDLYIKGISVCGTNIDDPKIAIIKNWKKLKGVDVAKEFDYYLRSFILDFWKQNDLDLGFIEKITRKFDITEAILKEYRSLV